MNSEVNNSAAQPLDLDRLEALARNVMAGKTTLERLEALHDWQGACDPATILALIAQARAAQPAQVDDQQYEVVVDRRDLFDALRSAWRERSSVGWTDTAESWHKATDYADGEIKGWKTMRPNLAAQAHHAAATTDDARDAERWRFSMRFQGDGSSKEQPQAIIDMWRKVYAEHRLRPTREEYEAAIDAAIQQETRHD